MHVDERDGRQVLRLQGRHHVLLYDAPLPRRPARDAARRRRTGSTSAVPTSRSPSRTAPSKPGDRSPAQPDRRLVRPQEGPAAAASRSYVPPLMEALGLCELEHLAEEQPECGLDARALERPARCAGPHCRRVRRRPSTRLLGRGAAGRDPLLIGASSRRARGSVAPTGCRPGLASCSAFGYPGRCSVTAQETDGSCCANGCAAAARSIDARRSAAFATPIAAGSTAAICLDASDCCDSLRWLRPGRPASRSAKPMKKAALRCRRAARCGRELEPVRPRPPPARCCGSGDRRAPQRRLGAIAGGDDDLP